MTYAKLLISVPVALTLAVSGCGIKGPLETAPPMWGKDRAAYEAEQARKDAARKAEEAANSAAANSAADSAAPASPAPASPPSRD